MHINTIELPLITKIKHVLWQVKLKSSKKSKRLLDILGSTAGLLLLSPLLVYVALKIKQDSPGAVIFKQDRVGLDGMPFTMYKFRSMVDDAENQRSKLDDNNESENGVIFKMKNDPRITNIGAFIRKTSIDELPQLLNVLRGEMSLVGPRPPLPMEVAQYNRADRQRLGVTPGITCLWQVSGRSEIPFKEQVKLDIKYMESRSLLYDLFLLLKTIPAVLFGHGAH
jgi:lipopolysaccharide/colanic/teichoic acid biosynthesis glycosyltransferase